MPGPRLALGAPATDYALPVYFLKFVFNYLFIKHLAEIIAIKTNWKRTLQ